MTRRYTLRSGLVIGRDMGCTVLGFAGVIHQEWWGPVSVPLLIFYASVLSVPAAANLLALRFGIASAPSQSVPEAPAQPSLSPPSNG